MAIYDYNNGTKSQIGKIYDYNNGTKSQIKKVWDYNNGTKSLIYTLSETVSGSTSDRVYGASGYNGAGKTIYSGYVEASDYSSVTVSGNLTGFRNDTGLGGCKLKIGIEGALSKSVSSTEYGSVSNNYKASGSLSQTWDLSGASGQIRCYNYFTCYSGDEGDGDYETYSDGALYWTFNP